MWQYQRKGRVFVAYFEVKGYIFCYAKRGWLEERGAKNFCDKNNALRTRGLSPRQINSFDRVIKLAMYVGSSLEDAYYISITYSKKEIDSMVGKVNAWSSMTRSYAMNRVNKSC